MAKLDFDKVISEQLAKKEAANEAILQGLVSFINVLIGIEYPQKELPKEAEKGKDKWDYPERRKFWDSRMDKITHTMHDVPIDVLVKVPFGDIQRFTNQHRQAYYLRKIDTENYVISLFSEKLPERHSL